MQTDFSGTFEKLEGYFPVLGMNMFLSFEGDDYISKMNVLLNLVFVRSSNAPIFRTTPGYSYFDSLSNQNSNYTIVRNVFYSSESVPGFYLIYNITDSTINNDLLQKMSIVLNINFIFGKSQTDILNEFDKSESTSLPLHIDFIYLAISLLVFYRILVKRKWK
ncbi:MAG: hypothetical protein ACW981_06430 [Candidatus Hodarchaeales archaeon]|jgi:hypothetical protein